MKQSFDLKNEQNMKLKGEESREIQPLLSWIISWEIPETKYDSYSNSIVQVPTLDDENRTPSGWNDHSKTHSKLFLKKNIEHRYHKCIAQHSTHPWRVQIIK